MAYENPSNLASSRTLPGEQFADADVFPPNWTLPQDFGIHKYTCYKLGNRKHAENIGDFDTRMSPREMLEYKSETDPHLKGYFQKPEVKSHLVKVGLVNEDGKVPCSLKEFNVYRDFMLDRDLERLRAGRSAEEKLLISKKASLANSDQKIHDRQKAMEEMLDQLSSQRKELWVREVQLENAKDEYQSLHQSMAPELQDELLEDIKRREKSVKSKRNKFDSMVMWLESIEALYQEQIAEKVREQNYELAKKQNLFQIRDFLQILTEEESNFKSLVRILQHAKRSEDRYRKAEERHKALNYSLYYKMANWRFQKQATEHQIMLDLLHKLGKVKGGSKDSSLQSLSMENSRDLQYHRVLADTMSLNVSLPAERLRDFKLEQYQQTKTLSKVLPLSSKFFARTIDHHTVHRVLSLRTTPYMIHQKERFAAKVKAKRKLMTTFEEPLSKVLYGKRPKTAPAGRRNKQDPSPIKTTARRVHSARTQSPIPTYQPPSYLTMSRATLYYPRYHTCADSYVDILGLVEKQRKKASKGSTSSVMSSWRPSDHEEQLRMLRQAAQREIWVEPNQTKTARAQVRAVVPRLTTLRKHYPSWARAAANDTPMKRPASSSSRSARGSRVKSTESKTSIRRKSPLKHRQTF